MKKNPENRQSSLLEEVLPNQSQAEVQEAEEVINHNASELPLPRLPYLLQMLTDHEEEAAFKAPLIIAMLPALGALATGVRFYDDEGTRHSLTFMTCIVGETSSGKSFVKRYLDLIISLLDEENRYAPHSTSRTALLMMIDQASGKHVFAFYPELVTLLEEKQSGVWNGLNAFLLQSFDNDIFVQKRISRQSWEGSVTLLYNLLSTCTPGVCAQFFDRKAIRDGLQNRFVFAQLPNRFAMSKPRRKLLTADEEYEFGCIAMWLMEQTGMIECPAVIKAIDAWQETKRALARATASSAVDTFLKRCGVIGFRAGMLCYLLEQERSTLTEGEIAAFATWVAEYVFRNHMDMFGPAMEEISKSPITATGHKEPYMLPKLPQQFTREQVSKVQVECGNTNSDPKQNISYWLKIGCIKKVEGTNLFEKVA